MRGLEVYLNEVKLCTAGIGPGGALNATLDIVAEDTGYDMTFRVGGLENDEFVIWSDRELRVGDEINIRVVETESVDRPKRRTSECRPVRARANVAPVSKSTSMPNFAESTMSDKQAKDIYAYIRTFRSTAPELKGIPTLNAIIEAASKPVEK